MSFVLFWGSFKIVSTISLIFMRSSDRYSLPGEWASNGEKKGRPIWNGGRICICRLSIVVDRVFISLYEVAGYETNDDNGIG